MFAKYHSHVDKLHLSFQTINFTKFESVNNSKTSLYFSSVPPHKDYGLRYEVKYIPNNSTTLELFGIIDLSKHLLKNHSMLYIDNPTLYRDGWSDTLMELLNCLGLTNIRIREIEIAIDTTQPIIKRYVKAMLKKTITFPANYRAGYYGDWDDVYTYGLAESIFHNTQYITPYNKSKKMLKRNSDRIESKSNEIFNHSHKLYINTFLTKYINTTKTVYRLEKTLYWYDLHYRNIVYIDTVTGHIISQSTYKRLCDFNKRKYIEQSELRMLNIDLSLLEESRYITSLYNHFRIFNSDLILDTDSGVPIFNTKQIKTYKPVTKTKKKVIPSTTRQTEIKNTIRILELELEYEYIIDNSEFTFDTDISDTGISLNP